MRTTKEERAARMAAQEARLAELTDQGNLEATYWKRISTLRIVIWGPELQAEAEKKEEAQS